MATQSEILKEKREIPGEVSHLFEQVGEKAQDFTSDAASKAKDLTTEAMNNIGSVIKKYPYQSFFWGLGIGCVLGFTATTMIRKT